MLLRPSRSLAVIVLCVVAQTTASAQEPTRGGLNMAVVQLPTAEDPTLLLDVGPWAEVACGAEMLHVSGNFQLNFTSGETSQTLRFGWFECLLVDPGGVEHCSQPPWASPMQSGTRVVGFAWFQGLYGGEPVYGDSLTTHRIDFRARDMTPRRVNLRAVTTFQYFCPGSGFLLPDEFIPAEISFFIGCRADIDGDGELTIFDFLAFQNLFAQGDPAADFDGDGELTIFDFLAFQNEFALGCD